MENRAWVTLLTNDDYINGMVVLAKSLAAVNTIYPLFCIVTPNVSQENRKVLEYLNVQIIDKTSPIPYNYSAEDVVDVHDYTLKATGLHPALAKFHIFGLTQFDKIVYIDNDVWIKENIDNLFELPHMSAGRDMYGKHQIFCSGLLVIKPNEIVYQDILKFLMNYVSKELVHDQQVLWDYYDNWERYPDCIIDSRYNYWSTGFDNMPKELWEEWIFDFPEMKSIHYVDKKPWNVGKQYFIDIYNDWPMYATINLKYIDLLNIYVRELRDAGITSPQLKEL